VLIDPTECNAQGDPTCICRTLGATGTEAGYWSATTDRRDPSKAHAVSFKYGTTGVHSEPKMSDQHFRAVRR